MSKRSGKATVNQSKLFVRSMALRLTIIKVFFFIYSFKDEGNLTVWCQICCPNSVIF
jgi:hypothetical protein